MKSIIITTAIVFIYVFAFSQNDGNKKDQEIIDAKIKTLQSSVTVQKSKINQLDKYLLSLDMKIDSLVSVLSSADQKVSANENSVIASNKKIAALSKSFNEKSVRIHKGKIHLMIIFVLLGLGILILFIYLYIKQKSAYKKLSSFMENMKSELESRMNTLSTETEKKLSDSAMLISNKMIEADKTMSSKLNDFETNTQETVENLKKQSEVAHTMFDSQFVSLASNLKESTEQIGSDLHAIETKLVKQIDESQKNSIDLNNTANNTLKKEISTLIKSLKEHELNHDNEFSSIDKQIKELGKTIEELKQK
ncbi:MAG: hypothetical protein ABIJ97_01210 [Bacteroidota bacterium]